ncbi:MAG: allophanate hydrolase [Bauldia sp.]|nr:allophanate hydrolase [Bauldia sp.]
MTDLAALVFTVPALRRAYTDGLSPEAVIDEMVRRLAEAKDPGIFIATTPLADLKAAAAALGAFDPDRPLWGIPVAVKDNIDVAGLPTTAACPDYAYQPAADAECVARLRAAGALIAGKTNLDQFATGLVGVRTPWPVPRNPFDPLMVPGGSSSGSAVAVARGIVPLALGTDTAGSGRVPAAFNNIVGLKPSVGSVSSRGMVPACRTLDCVSVFALTVEDAWTAYAVMGGYDPADPWSRRIDVPDAIAAAPPRVRIGVPRHQDRVFRDEEAELAFVAALSAAEETGAELVPIDFSPFFEVGTLLYGGPWIGERYAAIRTFIEENPHSLLAVTRQIIGAATKLTGADVYEGHYRLRDLARQVDRVWSAAGVDMLCVPSVPGPCSIDEVRGDPFFANARLGTYTNFVNLLDLAALAIPAGWRSDGAPAGVTLIGRCGDDARLAAFGHRLHGATTDRLGATAWALPRPHLPAPRPEGIPILVFGAHMSGLPLHGELLREGAQFGGAVVTAPDYRLHLLAGALPRPGLVRVPAGRGAAIAGEIWVLPADGFGRFVASVQPPLAIGTIQLSDGRQVKGFLAETEGVRGAPDISSFGGWRAYLDARSRQPQTAT